MAVEKLDTQVRKEQIAQATLELVAAGGLKKLNVAAVARRVGLVPSALYRHFKGKDEVLDATLGLIQDKLFDNVRAVGEETDDALEQLHGLLMRHVRMIRENRGIPQIIFSQDFYAGHPDRRGRVYRGIRSYLAEVARIVRDGREAGQVGQEVDAEAAAVMFLGLVQPSAILWHMSDGDFDVTRQAQRAWPLFLKAIQNGAASPPETAERAKKEN
ncbi:MAG TPA: TetR/AcrR family transcriptional regulator [Phycisphaerae bacterium]|nr:TetR/AcrR family transcriptional regulator [Phycisphaerae bacterium]